MAEYIEREAVLKHKTLIPGFIGEYVHADRIKEAPTADVAPVVHAKWIDGADSFGAKRGQYRVCSRCNICIPRVTEVAEPYWQYCPNCGSKNGR